MDISVDVRWSGMEDGKPYQGYAHITTADPISAALWLLHIAGRSGWEVDPEVVKP